MKLKALIAIALTTIATVANASGILARMQNNSGGYIEITNIPCTNGDGWMAHTYVTTNAPDIFGCWNSYNEDGSTISVLWTMPSGKQMRTYQSSSFNRTRYGMDPANWAVIR